MNFAKLKGKITEVFGNRGAFAQAMGMDNATLSAKLNNKSEWKRTEMEKACKLLHISIVMVSEYFFCGENCDFATREE